VIDLDDLLTRCAELLEDHPTLAAVERWRLRHVFVDEFQDVNPAQWRLLSAWRNDDPDLFVVGDPQQAIYSWNGADPSLLDRLPALVPGITVLRLDDNHRSTPQVLSAARAVLGDAGRAYAATRPDGPQPVVRAFEDDDDEATSLARWLRAAHRPGRPWSHIAVLARTNGRLEPTARALRGVGIPYRLAGNPRTFATLSSSAWLRKLPRHVAVRSALSELAAEAGLARAASADDGAEGLLAALARLADEHALDCPHATVGEFLDWLAAEDGGDVDGERADAVELSTFHRAKGLEWPSVAVVGLEDGMVPIAYASTAAAVAEERRLLYVALTRAENELWCSWARARRVGERCWRCGPSPLLAGVEAVIGDVPPVTHPGHAARRVDSLRRQLAAAG
jgi:DNA helicase-2/ATP-dependent DNA helicase PcrA